MDTRISRMVVSPAEETPPGVAGNARLTGTLGAVLFVLLAIEGVTVLRVHDLISAHVFVGMLIVPPVVVKTGATLYRFVRYYLGDPGYVRKGAPPVLLRMAGPIVVVTSIALLATGIGLLITGRGSRWLLEAHKASFILWFGVMTVHVLGHVIETPALAVADWTRRRRGVAAAGARRARLAVVFVTLTAGLALAVMSLGWLGSWR